MIQPACMTVAMALFYLGAGTGDAKVFWCGLIAVLALAAGAARSDIRAGGGPPCRRSAISRHERGGEV